MQCEVSVPRSWRSSCAFSRSSCATRASSAADCSCDCDTHEPRADDEALERPASSRAEPVSHRGLHHRAFAFA